MGKGASGAASGREPKVSWEAVSDMLGPLKGERLAGFETRYRNLGPGSGGERWTG
jgi:hypothetical protein